jgi:hypothetical protein
MACGIGPASSNLPDGGACLATASPGTATLTGPLAFPVVEAYEQTDVYVDGGGFQSREVNLLDAVQPSDGGFNLPASGNTDHLLGINMSGSSGTGTFTIAASAVDGGGATATLDVIDVFSDGGATILWANSGTVTLDTIDDCSLSGSFNVVMAFPDAGSPSALSGTFSAVYQAP